ncbi:MAG: hypothetical protein FJY74_05905 [Candidatus Eisenbacteria bacterium]|nr:hypothetical protein [Candidatus Eisenbacteria bacterium]
MRRAVIPMAVLMLAAASPAAPRAERVDDHLAAFPIALREAGGGPQAYTLDYDLFTRDITGATLSRVRVAATYTRQLEGARMRWSGVTVAGAAGADEPPRPGSPLEAMEGLEYGLGPEIVEEPLYERFADEDVRHLAKTMVWDGAMVEAFDLLLGTFGALRLNESAGVAEFEDFDVRMGDWGSLKMRGLRVTWSGVSIMHGEPCAVVLYESLSNPVDAGTVRGRSCYWGQFWVSCEDGDIECLTLNEDVILEMPAGGTTGALLNIQREVRFEKAG